MLLCVVVLVFDCFLGISISMDVPFFLALFVLSHHLLQSFSAQEDNKIEITCPKSFDCKPFPQPLRFSKIFNSTYSQCGLCTLTCDEPNQLPKVQLGNEGPWHDVLMEEDTSKNKHQVQIHDQILQTHLESRNCNAFTDFNFPGYSYISFTIYPNLTFYKCNKSSDLGSPTEDHFKELCYYYPDHNFSSPTPPPPSCSVIQLPMNSSNMNATPSDPFNLLTFSLKLPVSEDCQKCYQGGGQCQNDNQKFHCATNKGETRHGWILATAIPGGVVCLLIFIFSCRKKWNYVSSCFVSRKTSSNPSSKDDIEGGTIFFGVHVFSYTELEEATNNFDPFQELGDGGFGTVYHGKLRDGREVAVKRLYEHNYKRVTQFINEVQILTCLRHRNLVSLYGCTSRHSRELLLVYEYIPNGTLADHLHGDRAKNASLTWPVRMNIAIETASALTYLHASDIIHRDIKTNNILLDNNFSVKVADFGLSRLFPTDVTHVSTAPQGTPGYVDPEYHRCYQLTDKSDVYSFGVVLIELISSLRAVDIRRHGHEINLADLAINRIQNRAFDELIDPFLGFESDSLIERMTTLVAELAFQCLQRQKEMRPTMDEVLEALKEIQEYKYDNIGENCTQPPPSPESDDVVLLKNSRAALSPDSVTDGSVSTSATSISSG
ncbi:LEAF RUST 10 DISEASE-RESISTANCE LOCUS RECEPTOR-LIKE PROTEIN KINASE-like 1.1 [Camellia lanceoleosa]|uniref:LEAF RUST 10 DISEASE-RESISTANCE LOCUS RECEPTOR-LIKE PROTEIN KINASE-like 1.1 n=1 Tax=Camellia lanceoleosa TaxID=1840588 RepID=A0ACC0G8I8_9ERIC|nr:LEAF RUST 10 DISEASE-RESISTANCE LOCUS RECEPTOR-LIKE PROTEIN KINASE-like 1.1 [Camellia lanceoleosa]